MKIVTITLFFCQFHLLTGVNLFFFFCQIVAHQLLGLCGWGLFDFIVDFGRFLSLKLKDAQLIKDFILFIPVNARLSEACNLELMAVGRLDLHVEIPQAS